LALHRNEIPCLIRSAQEGDEHAISKLITIHKGLVFTIIFRMINDYDVSQELTQETFIRVCLNIGRVKNEQHFRPWMCMIARNIVRDYFRKAKRNHTISLEEIGELRGRSNIEMTRRNMIIQDALMRLNERDRMLLTLTYYQGFSLAEVGEAMRMSEQNVKVCLHRARRRLRKELRGHEHEVLSAR
jgi:RNA polymerase sigma-70 factor (ECF subfamily)